MRCRHVTRAEYSRALHSADTTLVLCNAPDAANARFFGRAMTVPFTMQAGPGLTRRISGEVLRREEWSLLFESAVSDDGMNSMY